MAPGRLAAVLFCALAIATLGALAVIQKVRLEGVVLDLAQVSRCTEEAVVSCNQRDEDRVFVRFRMRTDSDDAVVRIVDDAGEPVATLLDGGSLTRRRALLHLLLGRPPRVGREGASRAITGSRSSFATRIATSCPTRACC